MSSQNGSLSKITKLSKFEFVTVMQRKLWTLFFSGHDVCIFSYIVHYLMVFHAVQVAVSTVTF